MHHVHSIIDFGDIQYSCYVFELAIAIMYLMLEVTVMPTLDVGGHILAGYLLHRQLPQQEWEILKVGNAVMYKYTLMHFLKVSHHVLIV